MANPGTSKESAINIKTTSRLAGSLRVEERAVGVAGGVRVKTGVLQGQMAVVPVGTKVAKMVAGAVKDTCSSTM